MKQFILFGLFLVLLIPAKATHIVGGEFQMNHNTGFSYTFILNLYFDRVNGNVGAFDPTITVSIFEKGTNSRMLNFNMSNKSRTPVAYTSIACTNASLGTDKIVYTNANITLSESVYNSPNGYYVVWERCCRNNIIDNIVLPGNAGQAFYLEFPAVVRNGVRFINSSPELFPPLSDYACRNDLFYYDFGGSDPDGDSLVYEMVTPLNGRSSPQNPAPSPSLGGPFPLISWIAGLTEKFQIPGSPTVSITRNSGLLTIRPTQLGLFVFGVRVDEYRNNIKIGEVRRDFQLLVLDCPKNAKPAIVLQEAGKKTPYREGDIITIKATDNRCVTIAATDTDPNEAVILTARPVNFKFPGSFIPLTQGIINRNNTGDSLKTTVCFPTCLDSGGKVYKIDFIVSDDGCSLPKKDTVQVSFIIEAIPNTPPTITSGLAGRTIDLILGTVISDTIFGADPDFDNITITAAGEDFNLADYGMQFKPSSGAGKAKSAFSWVPDCEVRDKNQLKVNFTVKETTCEPARSETISVVFNFKYDETVEFIPANIFTPNNDGKNDYFVLPTLPPDYCNSVFARIKIYNRWGSEVYEANDRNFKWDGKNVPDGVYFYSILYTDREYKGTVTLVR